MINDISQLLIEQENALLTKAAELTELARRSAVLRAQMQQIIAKAEVDLLGLNQIVANVND